MAVLLTFVMLLGAAATAGVSTPAEAQKGGSAVRDCATRLGVLGQERPSGVVSPFTDIADSTKPGDHQSVRKGGVTPVKAGFGFSP